MLKIKTNKGYLDLGGDFTVQIDEKSPVMNDRGSQTVPVTIPCTGNNAKITGFAHRLDMGIKPMNEDQACTVLDGVYKRTGKINIVSAGKKEGITLNIGFDNSEAYSAWKAKKLNAITLPVKEYSSVNSLCAHLQQVLGGYQTDYAVFQIMTGNDSKDNQFYPKYLNYITPVSEGSKVYRLRYQARTETFLVNGTPTAVTLPEGYGVTAFLYVWRVLELVFSEFGYTIMENPFKTDKQLYNLVILNNAADCCVKGKLSYADLMPDCTVEDFLNALYVRFGLVYNVSSDTKTATLRLIRDIVDDVPDIDLSRSLTDEPLITYETARQMKLSAKTSFTGAAPSVERLEDYLKDQKVRKVNDGEGQVILSRKGLVADCESLQNIYGPKVEASKTDSAFLKKALNILKLMKCNESEVYFKASEYMYQIDPTADAAVGVAYMYYKKGDYDNAVKYFDEALAKETDNDKKAEMAYATAAALMQAKKLSQARSYCQKAMSFKENYGEPYILLAQLYGSNPNWTDEPALNKCTYFVVIDKLQRAKAVDPSVTERANELISTYSRHTPQAKDLFMLGYKAGDRITIGGWIGESTTIR